MYCVYILSCDQNKRFYTGLTDDLCRRNAEHKMGIYDSFTKKYGIHKLVYYESIQGYNAAQHREKLIKRWKRTYKISAIEYMNPTWNDLLFTLMMSCTPDPALRRG